MGQIEVGESYFGARHIRRKRGRGTLGKIIVFGLLRQFFPKRMALDNVSQKEAFKVTDLMNNRLRKCLGWKIPFEVFAQLTGKDYFLNGNIALMG